MKPPKSFLPKVVHFLTAFTIFMKGSLKLEHPQGYWPLIVFFFAASAYIVAITLLHARLHRHARMLDASVYAIECVATAIAAALSFHDGARLLPYAFAIASLGFAVATVIHLVKKHEARHLHS